MNTMALPQYQYDAEAEVPRGYQKLTCKGFREWLPADERSVQHPCGRIVWAPRQASMCIICAKASRAAHMRQVRAKAKRPTDFGQCLVCKTPLKFHGAERSTRKYCSDECRQSAYRARLKRAARRKR